MRPLLFALFVATLSSPLLGATKSVTHIVDVGAGLCTFTAVPTGLNTGNLDSDLYVFVYDAGSGTACSKAIDSAFDGALTQIDLMVISHSDWDHFGGANFIMRDFSVTEIWHSGYERDIQSWETFTRALSEHAARGAIVRNMRERPIEPGERRFITEEVYLTALFGPDEWRWEPITNEAELKNAYSIVMRLTVGENNLLFTGDTVGRRLHDEDSACRDAEALMVASQSTAPLSAEVMLAPHHGANNGSSTCFIEAVNPTYVIFSAGHSHKHPSAGAANRYLQAGVDASNMYRTDHGDREDPTGEPTKEWVPEDQPFCKDVSGDDDVVVFLYADKPPMVGYRNDGGRDVCG